MDDRTTNSSLPVFSEKTILETIRNCPIQPSDSKFDASPCKYCGNNPANGGNGICNCILGQPNIT